MTITEALKSAERITHHNRWMVYDEFSRLLVVYERKFKARKTTMIIETADEHEAFEHLFNKK